MQPGGLNHIWSHRWEVRVGAAHSHLGCGGESTEVVVHTHGCGVGSPTQPLSSRLSARAPPSSPRWSTGGCWQGSID